MTTRFLPAVNCLLSSIVVVFVLVCTPAAANDREKLLGNWKLVTFYTEDVQSKQRNNIYGERPNGYIGFTSAGRFFAIITADGRKPPNSTDEQAAPFDQ